MHAEAVHIGVDAHHRAVMPDNFHIYRSWVQVLGKRLADVVLHWSEKRAIKIILMFGFLQILGDQSLRFEPYGDVPCLISFAMDPEVQHTFTLLEITHTQLA